MRENRREFLKKSLKIGTAATAVLAVSSLSASSDTANADDNGVVVGKSNKKEVLYKKSLNWEKYYKVAY